MPRSATRLLRAKNLETLASEEARRERAVLEAVDESHRAVAQELHDTVCQSLSGVRLSAAALRKRLAGGDEKVAADFARMDEVAARTIGELHELVRSLQAAELGQEDFSVALESLAREMRGPIACDFRFQGDPHVADDFTASQLLKIARALATHAARGQHVTRLRIEWQEESGQCVLAFTADQPVFASQDGAIASLRGWELLARRLRAIGATLETAQGGASARITIGAAHRAGSD